MEVGQPALHREPVQVTANLGGAAHAQVEPAASEQPVPAVDEGAPLSAGDLAQIGGDFTSPFDDELDTPAFLRRRVQES